MAKKSAAPTPEIVCVTLNPAIDRTIEVRGLELGQHAQGRLTSRHPAGKAVNVARVLGYLGQPCILTGFVGETQRAMFERSFDSPVVQTQLFGLDSPTRENITLVDTVKGMETHVRDEGVSITGDDGERLGKKLRILARPNVWMVFAGSLPRGLSTTAFLQLLRSVIDRGAQVVLDSSEGAFAAVQAMPLRLIKPNRAELASLTGLRTDTAEEVLRAIAVVPGRIDMVLASVGADGCYLAEGGRILQARMSTLPKKVTNTVGCGDALLAGFLAAKARGFDSPAAVGYAVAVATSACFQLRAGDIDAVEVEALVPRVEVTTLKG